MLVVRVVGARIGDVVEHVFAGQTVALGDREQSFGSKRALGVDVHRFAFAAALRDGQLTAHAQLVTQLRFARAELAKDLSERATQ